MVRMFSSFFPSGRLANSGATSENSMTGIAVVLTGAGTEGSFLSEYLASVLRSCMYLGVASPDSLIGAS